MTVGEWIRHIIWVLAAVAVTWGIWHLESERAQVPEALLATPAGQVRIYGDPGGPLVVVTHGFAGSVQLMQTISRDLAQAGFTVAAFDFIGHGRNPGLLSSDVTRIEGTTTQLVEQTVSVVRFVRDHLAHDGPVSLLGHSMATDIIIRAADDIPEVAAIVAISMYSDAVTPQSPDRLLIVSGAWESRLREVALDAVRQVEPAAGEAQTVRDGTLMRRAVAAPYMEHLGVLYSPVTLAEVRNWLGSALSHTAQGVPQSSGVIILAVLVGISALSTLVARILPSSATTPAPLSPLRFCAAAALPAVPAGIAVLAFGGPMLDVAAFGSLAVFLGVWGAAGLGALWLLGRKPQWPDMRGVLLVVVFGLGVFALALDRYGAAFVPVGPRVPLMAALLLGTVPFMLADRLLVSGATLWQRALARVIPISVLLGLMIAWPSELGLLFTVLPVLALFYGVYGTMGHAVAVRVGPEAAGAGLGICLAWALAASTPLFAG